jgi:hypothetical protein
MPVAETVKPLQIDWFYTADYFVHTVDQLPLSGSLRFELLLLAQRKASED